MSRIQSIQSVTLKALVILVFLISACRQAAPETQPDVSPGEEVVKVALLLPGSIADGGWSTHAYEGLVELGREAGFQVAYAEDISQARIPEVTRGYADDAFDLIIGHGFEFGSAFLEIAPDYPNISFFATTFAPQENIPANLQFVDAVYFDASYSAGALAALLSESNIVGFVGGGDNPTQQGMMRAFVAGAEDTVPGTRGLGIVTGDYDDAAKGREAATTMIGNGADVIWHAADITGLGAIEGAVANQALVLGCYSDQTHLAPNHIGSSLVMDLAAMVVKLAHAVRDGTFEGGIEWQPAVNEMWHWQAGSRDHNPDIISTDVWNQFMQIWDDLVARRIEYDIN